MKVQDEVRWSEQVSDLRADGEAGARFLEFFEFWFDCAEKIYDEYDKVRDRVTFLVESSDPEPTLSIGSAKDRPDGGPVLAMRQALQIAEGQFGFLSVDLIGQMLTVATMHWIHGAALADQLTFIEHRVMEEALARKIADLQDQAATE